MTISTDDVVRVTARMLRSGVDDIVNVFHVKVIDDQAQVQAVLQDEIADYLELIYAEIIDRISDTVGFERIEMFNVTQDNPEPDVDWPTITDGTDTGAALPEGVTALSLGRTGVSKVVGKKYWPIFTEDQIDAGILQATALAAVSDAADVWIADFQGPSSALYTPGVWSAVLELFRPFVSTRSTGVLAYQRRRKRGVGS